MSTLFDYLHWRGDLSFDQDSFNIVDSLILTRFCYLPFDSVITGHPLSLQEVATNFFQQQLDKDPAVVLNLDIDLLKILQHSNRFKDLDLLCYVNKIDEAIEQQFSAMLIQLNDTTSYVAFRGTDLNLVGWKEDFNMAFEEVIPAQLEACRYVNALAPYLKNQVILAGHSKGGNLALYAGVHCDESIRDKIIAIHNFDGPGFQDNITQLHAYQQLKHTMHTYVPEMTVIGTVFDHDHDITFIQSESKSFEQHDTYTWKVAATDFIHSHNQTVSQNPVQAVLFSLLNQLSTEQRKQVINTIYHILTSANLKTLKDLQPLDISGIMKMLKTYANLNKEDTSLLHETISMAVKSALKKDKNRKN